MFTAGSILQLVQGVKIKLSDPFGNYKRIEKDAAGKVTIDSCYAYGRPAIFSGPRFKNTGKKKGFEKLARLRESVREARDGVRPRQPVGNTAITDFCVAMSRGASVSREDLLRLRPAIGVCAGGDEFPASLAEDGSVPGVDWVKHHLAAAMFAEW